MSSDMFSSMVEKDAKNLEPSYFVDIEKNQWKNYSQSCKARNNYACVILDIACDIQNCVAWQIKEYTKFGRIV
jgi:hypothetical protein